MVEHLIEDLDLGYHIQEAGNFFPLDGETYSFAEVFWSPEAETRTSRVRIPIGPILEMKLSNLFLVFLFLMESIMSLL